MVVWGCVNKVDREFDKKHKMVYNRSMKKNKERDEWIRAAYEQGLGGKLGRALGISRQRVGQIVHQKPKKKPGMWRLLWGIFKKLIN